MKNIERRGESFRAKVFRLGVRRTATFKTFDEAQAWVKETKWTLKSEMGGPLLSREKIMEMPRERAVCGVYFLFSGERLVYVGRSRDVYMRIVGHRRKRAMHGKFDSFSILRCDPDKLDFVERYYIDLLKPPMNVIVPKFYRDETGRQAMSVVQDRVTRLFTRSPMNSGAEGAATSTKPIAPL